MTDQSGKSDRKFDPVAHAVQRSKVRVAITECRACPLGRRDDLAYHPVPFRGKTPSRVMVLGEAAGPTDARKGSAFVGTSGKLLRQAMADVGLFFDDFFYTHVVCCHPLTAQPDAEYIKACSGLHLRPQIDLCDPEIVITLGLVALASVGFKAKLADVHGRLFLAPAGPFIGRFVLPTFHPMSVLQTPGNAPKIRDDLSTIRRLLSGSLTPDRAVGARIGRGGKVFAS